jgi:hypothetical protein
MGPVRNKKSDLAENVAAVSGYTLHRPLINLGAIHKSSGLKVLAILVDI